MFRALWTKKVQVSIDQEAKFFNTKHKVEYAVPLSVGVQKVTVYKADVELAVQWLIFQTEGNFGSLTEAADLVKAIEFEIEALKAGNKI